MYSAILCFWDPEEDYRGLNTTPYGEDDVGLPSYFLQRNGPGELIQESGWRGMLVHALRLCETRLTSSYCKTRESHALRSHLK